jgi:hypothetical protein
MGYPFFEKMPALRFWIALRPWPEVRRVMPSATRFP